MSVKAVQRTECDAMIERLLALDDDAGRKQLIAQHPSLDWDQLVATLTDRVRQEVHVSPANASAWQTLRSRWQRQSGAGLLWPRACAPRPMRSTR